MNTTIHGIIIFCKKADREANGNTGASFYEPFYSPGGHDMPESKQLNQTFHFIMERMIETGKAPHFTEIASGLGVSPIEGRKALHKLFSTMGFPGWLYPKTDNIVSFAPFNNLPTHYRLTIDGEQKWFGQ